MIQMKTMKQMMSILALGFLLFDCKTTEEQLAKQRSILAGQKDSKVLYQDFIPDRKVSLKNILVNNQPTISYSGILSLDLDLDGVDDLAFYSFYGIGHSVIMTAPSEGFEISDISKNKLIEIHTAPKKANDLIDKNLEWLDLSDAEFKNSDKVILSSYTPEWINVSEVKNNPWKGTDLYLAYRMIEGTETVYGWIGLQIDDYYKLTIRDTGSVK